MEQRESPDTIEGIDFPPLRHPQLGRLLNASFDLPVETLQEVLALPRESVVEDLLAWLKFAQVNCDLFREAAREGSLGEGELNFVPHACLLLAELEAEEALPAVLDIAEGRESWELYLGDGLGHGFWQVFYRLGRKNPAPLVAFAAGDGDVNARASVVEALEQLALHEPVWRDQVINWMGELLGVFMARKGQGDNLPATHAVKALRDLRAEEALPLIEEVFDREMAIPAVCGSLPEIKRHMADGSQQFTKLELLGIADLYQGYHRATSSDRIQASNESSVLSIPAGKPMRTQKPSKRSAGTVRRKPKSQFGKVGRNEPCPCGSGKKYKKCHGS